MYQYIDRKRFLIQETRLTCFHLLYYSPPYQIWGLGSFMTWHCRSPSAYHEMKRDCNAVTWVRVCQEFVFLKRERADDTIPLCFLTSFLNSIFTAFDWADQFLSVSVILELDTYHFTSCVVRQRSYRANHNKRRKQWLSVQPACCLNTQIQWDQGILSKREYRPRCNVNRSALVWSHLREIKPTWPPDEVCIAGRECI